MTLTKLALAYAKCSDTELSKFVQDRALDIAWTNRKAAIRSLREAGQGARFHFLNLPAEMRNMVYVELLTLYKKGGTSHRKYCEGVAILATCKQVYDEAHGVLYVDHQVLLRIVANRDINRSVWHTYPEYAVNIYVNGRILPVLDGSPNWPNVLRKFGKLKLSLLFESSSRTERAELHRRMRRVNNTLFNLYEFLSGQDIKLKEMQVDLSLRITASDHRLADMVSPICSIGAIIAATEFPFENVSNQVAMNIKNSTDILRKLLDRYEEANMYSELAANVHPRNDDQISVAHVGDMIVPTPQLDRVFTLPTAYELQEALTTLEGDLAERQDEDLEEVVQDLVGKWEHLKAKQAGRRKVVPLGSTA